MSINLQKKVLYSTQLLTKQKIEYTWIVSSPEFGILACGSVDGTVQLWNAKTGVLMHVLKEHTMQVKHLAFSPSGNTLASCSADHTVRLWQVQTGKLIHLLGGHNSCVNCVAFSPNGKIIASGSSDQTVRLWNVEKGELICVLSENNSPITAVAFLSDGNTLASCSFDGIVQLWAIEAGAFTKSRRVYTWENFGAAFSQNGTALALRCCDSTSRVLNLNTEESIDCGTGAVTCLAWSLDSKTFAFGFGLYVGSRDRNSIHSNLHLWDAKTKTLLQVFQQRGPGLRVAFAPNNKTLALCCMNGTIRLLHFWRPVQHLLQKYALLLCRCRHLSSMTIFYTFKSILKQNNVHTIVSDDDVLNFVDVCKRLNT